MFKWFWTIFSLGAPDLTPIRFLQYWNWKNLAFVVFTFDTTERMISMKSAVSLFLADHSNKPIKITRQFKDGNNFKAKWNGQKALIRLWFIPKVFIITTIVNG